jgi:hypothetical protein
MACVDSARRSEVGSSVRVRFTRRGTLTQANAQVRQWVTHMLSPAAQGGGRSPRTAHALAVRRMEPSGAIGNRERICSISASRWTSSNDMT